MKDVVIFHANCADGFGSAYMLYQALGAKNLHFIPAYYGEQPPMEAIKGRKVYMVDFCFPRAVIGQMSEIAESIHIYDHHKSAVENMTPLSALPDNVYATFDMTRSGTGIVFDVFIKNTTRHDRRLEKLAQYIQDRDLWEWKYADTKHYLYGLDTYAQKFEIWDAVTENINGLIEEGRTVERYINKQMDTMLEKPAPKITIDGMTVPCINAPGWLASELGNRLAKGNDFAAVWFRMDDKIIFSLRSSEYGQDVSAIAKKYGGGGHFHAAGFQVLAKNFFSSFPDITECERK